MLQPTGNTFTERTDLEHNELESFIRETRPGNPDTFATSALYYVMTGRKGAVLYREAQSAVVVCAHPHINDCLLVFPEISSDPDYELTAAVLDDLAQSAAPAPEILLARFSAANLPILMDRIIQSPSVSGLEVMEEQIMDWVYPVRILSTQKVASLAGSEFCKIRNKIRRSSPNLTFSPICESDVRDAHAVLDRWKAGMIRHAKDTADMTDLYHQLFEMCHRFPGQIDGLLFRREGQPTGFAFWDAPSGHTANLFANIADPSVVGSSDLQMVTVCRYLSQRDVPHLNLGGSELESLDAFKVKYQPVRSIDLCTVRVRYYPWVTRSLACV